MQIALGVALVGMIVERVAKAPTFPTDFIPLSPALSLSRQVLVVRRARTPQTLSLSLSLSLPPPQRVRERVLSSLSSTRVVYKATKRLKPVRRLRRQRKLVKESAEIVSYYGTSLSEANFATFSAADCSGEDNSLALIAQSLKDEALDKHALGVVCHKALQKTMAFLDAEPKLSRALMERFHRDQASSVRLNEVVFLLNLVAFFGYLVFPMTYFGPFQRNATLEWTGNFAGDLAWTLEPALLLVVKFFAAQPKQKAD